MKKKGKDINPLKIIKNHPELANKQVNMEEFAGKIRKSLMIKNKKNDKESN